MGQARSSEVAVTSMTRPRPRSREGPRAAEGSEVWSSSLQELGRYIRDEIAKWTRVVKEAGIRVE